MLKTMSRGAFRKILALNKFDSQFSFILNRNLSTQIRPEISQADKLTDIGTRSIFNEEHDIFRTSVRKFFKEEVVPHIDQWQKDGQVSREVWEKSGSFGLLGIEVPTLYGGSGSDFLTSIIPAEENSHVHSSGLGIGIHSDIVLPYLLLYGTEEQRQKYIPKMVSGKSISAIAMSEPGAGSDLQGIRTRATRSGSDWILNGSKIYISNGALCDVVIVVALTDPTAKSAAKGISLFIVESGTPGFKKGRKLEKIGLLGQDTSELFFEDVRLPDNALLGEVNHGFYYLMSQLPRERLHIAITCQAGVESTFELTREYVKDRKVFGRRLADLQVTQHKLAEMKTEICIGRCFVDNCIQLFQQGKLDYTTVSMAKYWVTDMINRVTSECLQLHGGAGYMKEYTVSRAFVDSRATTIFGGSNEIMKELIARGIVGKPK